MRPVFDLATELLSAKVVYWVEYDVLCFAIPVPIIAADGKMLAAYRLESGENNACLTCNIYIHDQFCLVSESTAVPGKDGLQLVCQERVQCLEDATLTEGKFGHQTFCYKQ